MREQRWESAQPLSFGEVLTIGEQLAGLGLAPANPSKDLICYIEEWTVDEVEDLDRLDPWPSEDVTLVRFQDDWLGDFFLLAGQYHTTYQRYRSVGTYCSISHPWSIPLPSRKHHARAMLWLGFRHSHGFIRIRLETREVHPPGEFLQIVQANSWLEERERIFLEAIEMLGLPIEVSRNHEAVFLTSWESNVPFFCSWPDVVGPCQFEFNTSDPYEFLVPASRLAATYGSGPARVRTYLTGFEEHALEEFCSVQPMARNAYRCSLHCPLDDLPEILRSIEPAGRLYATLCEFQTTTLRPDGEDASAIIGVMGTEKGFFMEIRLNRTPLPLSEMSDWLHQVLGHPLIYAPLPALP